MKNGKTREVRPVQKKEFPIPGGDVRMTGFPEKKDRWMCDNIWGGRKNQVLARTSREKKGLALGKEKDNVGNESERGGDSAKRKKRQPFRDPTGPSESRLKVGSQPRSHWSTKPHR